MTPLRSMTGFGRAEKANEAGTFSVEIKAVNHRFLDSRIHLPREIGSLEMPLSQQIKKRLARGKVDASTRWAPDESHLATAHFHTAVLEKYQKEIDEALTALAIAERPTVEFLLQLPGVTERAQPDVDEEALRELAQATLEAALDMLVADREREGEALRDEFLLRLDALEKLRDDVEARREGVVEAYRARLSRKANEWAEQASVQLDTGRLENEILYFAERSDITEELTRLHAHIAAFRDMIDRADDAPQGKPMEFLTQELLRETNTIASKARDTDILASVITMKNEIEKIREQVMNIE